MKTKLDSKFVKVRCPKCKNEQVIFNKSSTTINCLVCSENLAQPAGGKVKIKAQVLEVLS